MPNKLSESEIFAVLAKRRRRLLLRVLQDCITPVTINELARRIRNCEDDDPLRGDVLSIRLSLHHNHLPRLEEADVVGYNEREGTVRPERNYGVVVQFLAKVGEEDLPWSDE